MRRSSDASSRWLLGSSSSRVPAGSASAQPSRSPYRWPTDSSRKGRWSSKSASNAASARSSRRSAPPGVHPFDACKRGGVAVVGSRGAGGQRRRCGLELGRRPARRGDRIGAEVGVGRPARGDELLLDKPAVGGVDDHSGVGLDGSGQQPQQCALPAAVLTDDGEALAGRNGKGNPVENGSVAEPFAEFARCEVKGGRLRDGTHETTS